MRKAFTLIELLVVIAVIAVLVGLLFPATCRVRRVAMRMVCQNNLKMLGVGIENYRDTHGHYPPGTAPGTQLPPDERLSFYATLLPFVEQDAVHRKLKPDEAWDSRANRTALAGGNAYTWRLYHCPDWMAARGPETGADAATGHLSVTNYVGVAGVGADAADRPADAPGVGLFGYDRTLKPDQVKDGLSNTLRLIETGAEVGPWACGGPATVRGLDPDAGHLTGDGLLFGGTHFRETGVRRKLRPDGFNVLLGDASVRYVRDAADPAVLMALGTIAGGEQIPTDW